MNPNLVTSTVEIFHDIECGRLDTTHIIDGIDIVAAIAGRLDVLGHTRMIKVSKPGADTIDPTAIRWPILGADINIVVTERPIIVNERRGPTEQRTVSSTAGAALADFGVAIIDSKTADSAKYTTAHELGHLFELKEKGHVARSELGSHCAFSDCLMFPSPVIYTKEIRVAQTGIRKGLEKLHMRKTETELVEENITTDFCDECSTQLEETAVRQALSKLGIHIPIVKPPIRRVDKTAR